MKPIKPLINPLLQGMQETNTNINNMNMPNVSRNTNQPQPLESSLINNQFSQNKPINTGQNQSVGVGSNVGTGTGIGTGNEVMGGSTPIEGETEGYIDPDDWSNTWSGGFGNNINWDIDPDTGNLIGPNIHGPWGSGGGGGWTPPPPEEEEDLGTGDWNPSEPDPIGDYSWDAYDYIFNNINEFADYSGFQLSPDWVTSSGFGDLNDTEVANLLQNMIHEYVESNWEGFQSGELQYDDIYQLLASQDIMQPTSGSTFVASGTPYSSNVIGSESGRVLSTPDEGTGTGFASSGEGISTVDSLLSKFQQGSKI
tara:strand:+ start:231 stop:1163 length:933 start_codon:yes stop_codon:yes gene_type:complete